MSYASYLSHHGIKGQKWGVENGPPYPLNDVVKAIAYRGGEMSDGRKVMNFTKKDVRKARKLVNKNMKTMTSEEIKEYKSRLLLEKEMGEILGTDTTDKMIRNLKNKAVEAVGDSVKQSGTKMLSNLEINAVGAAIEAVFGPDVRNMITDGITKYQAENKKSEKKQKNVDNRNTAKEKVVNLNTAYNNAKDDEIKDIIKNMIRESGEEFSRYGAKVKEESPKSDTSKQEKKSESSKYERVQGEIVNDTPKSDNDYKYTDKEKVNGEWRYYYEPTYYDSWNSDYLLPGSSGSGKSKKKRKKK
jgi:hypothetical protein